MTLLLRAALAGAVTLSLGVASAGAALAAGVLPAHHHDSLAPGESITIIKSVETPDEGAGFTEVTVTYVIDCDPGLTVELEEIDGGAGFAGRAGRLVGAGLVGSSVFSGDVVEYYETITVGHDAVAGSVLECSVEFLVDGALPGPEFVQTITIHVVDRVAPTGTCQESTNPAGNIPQSGKNPKSGQNPDGFYVLLAADNLDPDPQVFLEDTGSGHVFGPYDSGQKIKYTQSRSGPTQKRMPGGILHLTGTGDGALYAVDASGNVSEKVDCLVPEPPK